MGVREILSTIVLVLLIPFIVNQVSSRLDFTWSGWAAAIAVVIAIGLIITSDTLAQRVWIDIGRRHRALVIVTTGLSMGLLGAAVTCRRTPSRRSRPR